MNPSSTWWSADMAAPAPARALSGAALNSAAIASVKTILVACYGFPVHEYTWTADCNTTEASLIEGRRENGRKVEVCAWLDDFGVPMQHTIELR